ncbi:unnamed protein product, partial [Hermetia illucens]
NSRIFIFRNRRISTSRS